MTPELKILFVEDFPTDVELAKRTLTKERIVFQSRVVDTEANFLHELEDFFPDIIISDFKMPQFNGLRALNLTLAKSPATPFILLTGSVNEEVAVECMKNGATDYIIKEHIARLPLAVKDALEKKKIILAKEKAELELNESLENNRLILENSMDAILLTLPDGGIIRANRAACEMFQMTEAEICLLGRNGIVDANDPRLPLLLQERERIGNTHGELTLIRKDKSKFPAEITTAIFTDSVGKLKTSMIIRDVTERNRAEESLRESEEKYYKLVNFSPYCIVLHSEGKMTYVNEASIKLFGGKDRDDFIGKPILDFVHPDFRNVVKNRLKQLAGKSIVPLIEEKFIRLDGTFVEVEVSATPITLNGEPFVQVVFNDITERKRSEKSMREYAEQYRTMVSATLFGFLLVGEKGKLLDVNDTYCSMSGYTKEELLNLSISDLEVIDKPEDVARRIQRIIERGTEQFESKHRAKDGRVFDIEISISFLYSQKQFIGFIREITDRKRAEEELKNKNTFIQTVLDNLPIGIALNEIDKGNSFYINKKFEEIYGWPKDEMKNISDFFKKVYPDIKYREELETKILADIKSGDPSRMHWEDCTVTHKDGSKRIVDAVNIPLNEQNTMVSTVIDITERKLAEEELHKLSRAVEQSPALVIITNPDGDIEYVNKKFCLVTGYTKEEVIGENPRILKSGHQDQQYYKELWDTILAGKEWIGEFLDKKKDGELYWESARISPMVNKDGDITHFVAVKEDITEKKKMIEELIIAKERAEEMSRLKSNFLNNMSHELRTPLNGIMGYANILASELEKPDEHDMALGIYDSGKRLSETLNLILDLSEAESGKIEVIAKDVVIVPLVKNSIKLFTAVAAKKNLQIETIIKDEIIFAHIDENLLNRIVYNLLDNALKFTERGKISIEVGREVNTENAPDNSPADWLFIKIKDTGIGIAAHKIDNIWDEFRQVSEGMSRSYEGTGLGLTIAKKAVELMQGKISVESELGVGSTFTVKFPAVKVSPQEEEVTQSMQTKVIPRNKEKRNAAALPLVLYIEDDFSNRHIVKLFLENISELETAADGKTALQLAAGKKYELFLMDINLGGAINGMEVVNALRKMPQYAETPIIAVTAYAMGKDKAEFLNGGCTHYLAKPFKKQELIDLVSSALKNK